MILTRSEIETLSGIRNINEAQRTQRMFSYSSTSVSVFCHISIVTELSCKLSRRYLKIVVLALMWIGWIRQCLMKLLQKRLLK